MRRDGLSLSDSVDSRSSPKSANRDVHLAHSLGKRRNLGPDTEERLPDRSSILGINQPSTLLVALRMWACGLAALRCVCLFWARPILLMALLVSIAVVMLEARRSVNDVLLVVGCGVFGALAEASAIASGAWAYAVPAAGGVPLWLPAIWGIAALFIKEMAVLLQTITPAVTSEVAGHEADMPLAASKSGSAQN